MMHNEILTLTKDFSFNRPDNFQCLRSVNLYTDKSLIAFTLILFGPKSHHVTSFVPITKQHYMANEAINNSITYQ